MSVRAKFVLASKTEHPPQTDSVNVVLKFTVATSGEDNRTWSKWTPTGELTMTVTNPAAVDFFKPGKAYYLDFTEAPLPPHPTRRD